MRVGGTICVDDLRTYSSGVDTGLLAAQATPGKHGIRAGMKVSPRLVVDPQVPSGEQSAHPGRTRRQALPSSTQLLRDICWVIASVHGIRSIRAAEDTQEWLSHSFYGTAERFKSVTASKKQLANVLG